MKRLFRRNQKGQLHVVEAIIVGILVFTILFVTSVFRIPTSPATFQQAELAGLARDTLVALYAKPPNSGAECNSDPDPCPFQSELERMLSLSLGYGDVAPDSDELVEYLSQALPPGTGYILSFSNGVSSTVVYPTDVVAPALDVSVGHLFLTFAWDEYAGSVDDSMVIRIGEETNFLSTGPGAVTAIRDPLIRTGDQYAVPHLTSFLDGVTVPDNALYGTYEMEYGSGPETAYFTIVPPGIAGAGSFILPGDRDTSTAVTSAGDFASFLRYIDVDPAGFDDTDPMYLDLAAPLGSVSAGDLRLSRVTDVTGCRGGKPCAAGSQVEVGDSDFGDNPLLVHGSGIVRASATGDNSRLEEGDGIYYDREPDGLVSPGDRRLTRVGPYAFGSVVVAGDADQTTTLATLAAPAVPSDFTQRNVWWADDGDTIREAGEPVYLDLVGHGQSAGLEAFDVHLSNKGNPTARYVYDIRMVVWYGI